MLSAILLVWITVCTHNDNLKGVKIILSENAGYSKRAVNNTKKLSFNLIHLLVISIISGYHE